MSKASNVKFEIDTQKVFALKGVTTTAARVAETRKNEEFEKE